MSRTKQKFKPNTLLAYKGGGYDGCIYEWNYAYIDQLGEFHSFYASGSMGCDTLEELNDTYDAMQERIRSGNHYRENDIELYAFDNPNDCRRFVAREPVDNVLLVARLLGEGRYQVRLPCVCDKCGLEVDLVASEFVGAKPQGVGGIEIRNQELVCKRCALADEYDEEEFEEN